jgi:hypothetical protein
MSKRMRTVVSAAVALAVVAAASAGVTRLLFERRIAREVDDLFAETNVRQSASITEADLARLPEPVKRWLHYAQVVGTERVFAVRLKQEGEFRLGEDRSWMPYTAEQYFTIDPPGFIWSARFDMAPGVTIIGRDRYVEGEGDIEMRLLGVIPVADSHGGLLNQGAMLRYLGETVWFPAAALSPYISWDEVDATSARATMSYGGVIASALFVFDDQGRPVNISAERNNDSTGKQEKWSAPQYSYGVFRGIHVPITGDGIWHYDTGDFSYIHWRITEIEYNVLESF